MFERLDAVVIGRNLAIYGVGLGLAIVGALGLAAAIEISVSISAVSFVGGLALIVAVHEWLDGPF